MARNTQLLLLEESHLGRVLDPAGGSWAVEQLTEGLAQAAWAVLGELEEAGGFRAALRGGELGELLARTRTAREHDVAHRVLRVTGVNEFPDLEEAPPSSTAEVADPGGALPVIRYAQPFEALRTRSDAHLAATGSRPQVRLATVGPLAEHAARADWVRTLLAAGGIATTADPGPVVVLCASDKRYRSDGAQALRGLREERAGHVLLAGSAGAWPDDAPPPDGTLAAGDDAVAALTALLDVLEVAP